MAAVSSRQADSRWPPRVRQADASRRYSSSGLSRTDSAGKSCSSSVPCSRHRSIVGTVHQNVRRESNDAASSSASKPAASADTPRARPQQRDAVRTAVSTGKSVSVPPHTACAAQSASGDQDQLAGRASQRSQPKMAPEMAQPSAITTPSSEASQARVQATERERATDIWRRRRGRAGSLAPCRGTPRDVERTDASCLFLVADLAAAPCRHPNAAPECSAQTHFLEGIFTTAPSHSRLVIQMRQNGAVGMKLRKRSRHT
eukprot:scaffold6748_cov122-Isochrysis_galbana.AAC.2